MKSVTLQQIYNLSRKYVFSLLKHNKVQFDDEKIKNDDGYINNRYEATILFFNAGLFNFDIEDLSKEEEIMKHDKDGKIILKYFGDIDSTDKQYIKKIGGERKSPYEWIFPENKKEEVTKLADKIKHKIYENDKNIEKIFNNYIEDQKEGLFFQDDSVILKPRFKELYISSMKRYREDIEYDEDDDDINFYFDSIFLELDDEKDLMKLDEVKNLTEEYESDEDPEEIVLEEEVINDGNTGEDQALKLASELGNLNIVKKLLDGNQNIKTDEALNLAYENGHSKIVELLKSYMKKD